MKNIVRDKICFYNSVYQGRSSAFEIADFAAKNGVGGVELMSFCDELRVTSRRDRGTTVTLLKRLHK